jgi:hypothetical protein
LKKPLIFIGGFFVGSLLDPFMSQGVFKGDCLKEL